MANVEIRVEDDRTGMDPVTLKRAITDHLRFTQSKSERSAHRFDWYVAIAHMVRDRLVERWIKTEEAYARTDAKRVYYLSAEFLPGRFLANNLINLGLYEPVRQVLEDMSLELADLLEQEKDPGLGNGGLGRLAACFLDSLATLAMPAMGQGIRYEFGIFHQEIREGRQIEQPDEWLQFGNPWEIARIEDAVTVGFGGTIEERPDKNGRLIARWTPSHQVVGVPYDTPIVGYGNDTVNTLRLWRARASEEFDLAVFNDGDYRKAVEEKAISESISKVLYPNDHSYEGKVLRLKQQYFFCRCAIHDIVLRYLRNNVTFDEFPDKVAIQLNDTHPVIAVVELMRVFLDDHGMAWDRAWDIVHRTFGYTNHTLLTEALERWPVSMFETFLPRHLSIMYEINRRFLRQVIMRWPNDNADRQRRMSLIEEGKEKQVRMANLAVVASHKVNGVAALHSELVRTELSRTSPSSGPSGSPTRPTASPRGAGSCSRTRGSPAPSPTASARAGSPTSRSSTSSCRSPTTSSSAPCSAASSARTRWPSCGTSRARSRSARPRCASTWTRSSTSRSSACTSTSGSCSRRCTSSRSTSASSATRRPRSCPAP